MVGFELVFSRTRVSTITQYFSLKNGPNPASFSFLFSVFSNKQINVNKCPSCIRCWDSNPQPFEHELSPVTTRPGLNGAFFILKLFHNSVLNRFRKCVPSEINYYSNYAYSVVTGKLRSQSLYSHHCFTSSLLFIISKQIL